MKADTYVYIITKPDTYVYIIPKPDTYVYIIPKPDTYVYSIPKPALLALASPLVVGTEQRAAVAVPELTQEISLARPPALFTPADWNWN